MPGIGKIRRRQPRPWGRLAWDRGHGGAGRGRFPDAEGSVRNPISSDGSTIHPREVEGLLQFHLDVLEVSVIGRPDPEWGEDAVAFVVQRPVCGRLERV
ncbi:AMP-binding enzyme [Sagittula marina]|uniref:AMP-binding enzyme n=1 Tax=Sagittula marina TaxID=943940 RepID=UPI001FE598FC|nr:hypothetical protein [Sagittula marina]